MNQDELFGIRRRRRRNMLEQVKGMLKRRNKHNCIREVQEAIAWMSNKGARTSRCFAYRSLALSCSHERTCNFGPWAGSLLVWAKAEIIKGIWKPLEVKLKKPNWTSSWLTWNIQPQTLKSYLISYVIFLWSSLSLKPLFFLSINIINNHLERRSLSWVKLF